MKNLITVALVACAVTLGACNAKADTVTCYGGAALGYAMSNTSVDANVPLGTLAGLDGVGAQGAEVSLKGGCDVNLGGGLVAGPFFDYTWHNDHSTDLTLFGNSFNIGGLDTQWSAGGRIGYMVTDTALIYALLAYTRADTEGLLNTFAGITSFDGTSFGGGVELKLGGGFVGTLEYRYTDFDEETFRVTPALSVDVDPDMHAVRAGLAYRFGTF